jgi:hypothetical protein
MTTSNAASGRTHCTVTMTPDLYRAVKERCRLEDKPLTVWVRDLIKRELRHPSTESN